MDSKSPKFSSFVRLPLLNIQVRVINKNQATGPPMLLGWGVGQGLCVVVSKERQGGKGMFSLQAVSPQTK